MFNKNFRGDYQNLSYMFSRRMLEIMINILFKVRYYGREHLPKAPYIVVPNHVSLIDPPLAGVACKKDT
ncbi:MAG: 1-acyl-sn-glycerol-3-phosphate acyltransferase, partial [Candidatus Omnitrophica bacterium]|nr:1-acyl-sn-glycerol-3-phosphate acyltransferase [Candidatus Omnitrophota bacterium]